MSCCDTLSEKNNQLRIDYVELMSKELDLLAEIKRLREQLAKANKYVHSICQHSDSMLMDYEDYMKGDD